VGRSGSTTHGGTYPRPTGCHIYEAPYHLMGQCPWKGRFQKFMANHMSSKPDVGINGVVIEELKGANVDVALTRAQQAKTRIPLMADDFKEKEPRKPKTKQDWEKEEAIRNSMLEAIENINQQGALARAQEKAEHRSATIMDGFDSSSGIPLEGDWVGFPDADALEAGTQKDARQRTTGLYNVGQHNTRLYYAEQSDAEQVKVGQHIAEQFREGQYFAEQSNNGLHYTKQSYTGQHYSGQSTTRQCEMMAKVVGRQVLDTSITVSLGQLLDLVPNLTNYVKSQVFPVPTTKPTTMKMPKGQGSNVTLQDKNSVIARAVDVDRGLLVIAV
jgi:hypothetical protein